jgi:hypothetical protein
VWASSELVESFGGAGYLEDTGIPRLLRDVHVHCIWEGTTTVLALDVLRALRDPATGQALLDDIRRHLSPGPQPVAAPAERAVREALPVLERMIGGGDPAQARELAWGLARTYEAALLVAQARWAATTMADHRTATAAVVFTARPLVDAPPAAEDDALAAFALEG